MDQVQRRDIGFEVMGPSHRTCRYKLLVLAYLGGKRTMRMTFRAQGVFSEVVTFGLIFVVSEDLQSV